jgi:hypothetical protein
MAAPMPRSFAPRILHLLGPALPASSRCGTSLRRAGAEEGRPSTPILAQLPPDLTRPPSVVYSIAVIYIDHNQTMLKRRTI